MADSLLDDTVDNTADRDALFAKWKDKSPEDVLKAKVESDLYIKTLTARMDEIRDDYLKLKENQTATAQLEELIARQEKLLSGTNTDTTHTTDGNNVNQPSFKAEDIDAMLEKKLSAREILTKQTTNFNTVKAKIKEQFGDNANAILKQRMDALGLDQEFTDNLAKNHPSVFFKTFGLEEQQRQTGFQAPPRSNQRATSFAPTTVKRDWNYYQELKKSDPRLYLDPKIAVQMHNDAIEQGEAFGMPED